MTQQKRPETILPHPAAPHTLEEAGLSKDMVLQLVLKTLHFAGELTGIGLADRLGVAFSVIEPALELLKAQHHCEIIGGSLIGGSSYKYRITDAGRTRAALFLDHNEYVGVAPVPATQYQEYMRRFRAAVPRSATPERVREAFSELVLTPRVLDNLGPAINAQRSMFLYGSPGNGKSLMAQRIRGLLDGDIAIPHAIEIEGQVVRLFDPVQHEELPLPDQSNTIDDGPRFDRRWVRCRRPLIIVGGELTLENLDLARTRSSGYYRAPVQVAANGGVLVIDDFGRQRCSPTELLNRWIGPLETRVDYLVLHSGQRFEVPFQVLLVFATNIRPSELVDEAFLRRIHFKIFAESPSVADFHRIFERYCQLCGVEFQPALVEDILQTYYHPRQLPLRGCHPRDLIDQALSMADYLGQPKGLTKELLYSACASYFVDDREPITEYV
jgi:predicted ATPase with chaperone activity